MSNPQLNNINRYGSHFIVENDVKEVLNVLDDGLLTGAKVGEFEKGITNFCAAEKCQLLTAQLLH